MAAAETKRRPGWRSRARARMASTASGTAGLSARGLRDVAGHHAARAPRPWCRRAKSRSPVSISKSTAPREKMSLRWSARISTTISGAMYAGLPAR